MNNEEKTKLISLLGILIGGFVLLYICSCGTFKGMAHDLAWTFDKVDRSITVPEN